MNGVLRIVSLKRVKLVIFSLTYMNFFYYISIFEHGWNILFFLFYKVKLSDRFIKNEQ